MAGMTDFILCRIAHNWTRLDLTVGKYHATLRCCRRCGRLERFSAVETWVHCPPHKDGYRHIDPSFNRSVEAFIQESCA